MVMASTMMQIRQLSIICIAVLMLIGVVIFFGSTEDRSEIEARQDALVLEEPVIANNFNLYDMNHNHLPVVRQMDESTGLLKSIENIAIPNVDPDFWSNIETIYVIPGGGSGGTGYPEWTRRRTSAAYEHFGKQTKEFQNKAIFLALSTGSLNAPNVLFDDKRIMFECQHVLLHLKALGISSNRLYGDFFSWDTVTNGISLRLFLESMMIFRPVTKPPIQVIVFISDFHAMRMQASLQWALDAKPSLLIKSTQNTSSNTHSDVNNTGFIKLQIQVVDSLGIDWGGKDNFEQRIKHEEEGTKQIRQFMQIMQSWQEILAYILLGGHQGLRKYMLNEYKISSGSGW